MGVAWSYVLKMEELGLLDRPGAAVLDIGSSNLYQADAAAIAAFVRRHAADPGTDLEAFAARAAHGSGYDPIRGGRNETFLGEVLERAGFRYTAIDIADGYRTRIVDLNHGSLPRNMVGAYDSVINFGTTEHILNQMNSFRMIHDATTSGGFIWHQLPAIGYVDHGYFTYTGRFFFDLAGYNHYEIVDAWFDGPGGDEDIFAAFRSYQSIFPRLADRLARIGDHPKETALAALRVPMISLNVVYRKVNDAPFNGAVEMSTSVGLIGAAVSAMYSGDLVGRLRHAGLRRVLRRILGRS